MVILAHEEVFDNVWSTGENSSSSLWLTRELVLILPTKGYYQLHGKVFFTTHKGVAFVPWTCEEVLPWYCTLLGIWLIIWTHKGVSLATSYPLRDVFDAFNPLGCFEGLCVFYPTEGISVIFMYSWIFFCISYLWGTHWGYLKKKLLNYTLFNEGLNYM